MNHHGNAVLITGASSGIGEAFARTLAAKGTDLLLSALPEEGNRLAALAEDLTCRHGVRVEVATVNLAERDAAHRLQAMADELRFEPDLLVNSAGIGVMGAFAEAPLDRQLNMIHVNVEALVTLTGLYLPRLVARRCGAVINVVSTSAFQPLPNMAVYAASKAFVLSFSEALWVENRRHGVKVVAVCPGPVSTGFQARAGGTDSVQGLQRRLSRRYLSAEMVVESALDALENDHPTVVRRLPGANLLYTPVAFATGLTSRRFRLLAIERLLSWL